MIVDPGWHVGLRLADCLATGGYHAVLVRDLESTLPELVEIQPAAILLGPELRTGASRSLRTIRAVCPHTSVFNFVEPPGAAPIIPRQSADAPEKLSHPYGSQPVEDWLQVRLGIPCARVQ
jgi:hypothetical protein